MIICRVIKTNLGHKGELDLWYYAETSLFDLLIGQNGGPLSIWAVFLQTQNYQSIIGETFTIMFCMKCVVVKNSENCSVARHYVISKSTKRSHSVRQLNSNARN